MEDKNIVYVCFVLNDFGILNGDDAISHLMVTQSQKKIDAWLEQRLAEAAEEEYRPYEDIKTYKDAVKFNIAVIKGNEKDGFDSYYFVCMPAIIE